MKKLYCILAILIFGVTITSCTADEIPTNNSQKSTDSSIVANKDGDEIDPPKVVTTPPPPPPPALPSSNP